MIYPFFCVADPTNTVTMSSPTWIPGWHTPRLKLAKAFIHANLDDTHALHRLGDEIFSQQQERLNSGVHGPAAFRMILTDIADHCDRAPRGAALETLQTPGVSTKTSSSSYLRTVDRGGLLAPSSDVAMELIRIRTAQQYPILTPTLFPSNIATRDRPYGSLTTTWTAFADLKHNTSPAICRRVCSSVAETELSRPPPPPPMVTTPVYPTALLQRNTRRQGWPDASHSVLNVTDSKLPKRRYDRSPQIHRPCCRPCFFLLVFQYYIFCLPFGIRRCLLRLLFGIR